MNRFYLASRYSAIGTLEGDDGYEINAMNSGGDLGFNTRRVDQISVGVGFRLTEKITIKAEYSWFDFDLVRGVTPALREAARSKDYGGIGLSLGF